MGFWRSVRTYRGMPPGRRRLARLAYALLLIPRPALLFMSVDRVRALLDRIAGGRKLEIAAGSDTALAAHRTAAMVNAAARYVWPYPSCLHRSLVMASILSAQRIRSEIRYGVRRKDARFEAHAWVEHAGQPLTEPGELHREYEPLRAAAELRSPSRS